MTNRKWTTEENILLMEHAYKVPWPEIAKVLDRSELACQKHYKKIRALRIISGTWKGI